jgi:hypothetical protein
VLRDQILELRAEGDTGRHASVRGPAPAVR